MAREFEYPVHCTLYIPDEPDHETVGEDRYIYEHTNVRWSEENGAFVSPMNLHYIPVECLEELEDELNEAAVAPSHDGKADRGRSPIWRGVLDYFPRAVGAVADLSALGAKKYEWKGWETVPDAENRYRDALARHIVKRSTEGTFDSDWLKEFGERVRHDAAVAWNALAVLELSLREAEDGEV